MSSGKIQVFLLVVAFFSHHLEVFHLFSHFLSSTFVFWVMFHSQAFQIEDCTICFDKPMFTW